MLSGETIKMLCRPQTLWLNLQKELALHLPAVLISVVQDFTKKEFLVKVENQGGKETHFLVFPKGDGEGEQETQCSLFQVNPAWNPNCIKFFCLRSTLWRVLWGKKEECISFETLDETNGTWERRHGYLVSQSHPPHIFVFERLHVFSVATRLFQMTETFQSVSLDHWFVDSEFKVRGPETIIFHVGMEIVWPSLAVHLGEKEIHLFGLSQKTLWRGTCALPSLPSTASLETTQKLVVLMPGIRVGRTSKIQQVFVSSSTEKLALLEGSQVRWETLNAPRKGERKTMGPGIIKHTKSQDWDTARIVQLNGQPWLCYYPFLFQSLLLYVVSLPDLAYSNRQVGNWWPLKMKILKD